MSEIHATEYRVLSDRGGGWTTVARVYMRRSPRDPGKYCVRMERESFDESGGVTTGNPFCSIQRLRDYFSNYADYTLSEDEAVGTLLAFEKKYPLVHQRDIIAPYPNVDSALSRLGIRPDISP